MRKLVLKISAVICIFSLSISGSVIFAQETQVTDVEKAAQQADLEAQLREIQVQIDLFQSQLSQTQAEKNTLNNKIKGLKKQQDVLGLQIKSTNLQVNDLGSQIEDTEKSINDNVEKTKRLKIQVAEIIRTINQKDSYPLLYTVVSKQKLSEVFSVYHDYAKISDSLAATAQDLRATNIALAEQQEKLTVEQEGARNLLAIKVLQQTELSGTVSEQNVLLSQTKGKEADYQIVLNDTRRRAGEIQSRIYSLLGISSQITFGEALKIANWVSQNTGIRPAFLLAILTQESNLGKNVGTCNRAGDPPEKGWREVMKPDRDQQPFLQITSDLGLDPETTPVSCPMRDKRGKRIGWGGAMGPAQFIPSTWMGYKDKVAEITGKTANPWDIRDAFIAAAVKLRAGGADGSYKGEWSAAMRYFSGSTNTRYRFYGDNVMETAEKYEADIQALGK